MTLESRSITCVADDEVVAVDDWAESSAFSVRAGVPPSSVVRVAIGTYDQRSSTIAYVLSLLRVCSGIVWVMSI